MSRPRKITPAAAAAEKRLLQHVSGILRARRHALNLRMIDVEKVTGITQSTLARIEAGTKDAKFMTEMIPLSRVLRLDISELLTMPPPPTTKQSGKAAANEKRDRPANSSRSAPSRK